ncbi:hypothetical protein Vadar_015503 [Vaccinium darrowii]|uniref:Uncharacterized protein n=1 Tax=Vaccinium darrowii TaxID=229202 RepID=A0ACB7XHM8_9ERIC|nr:hypothetical protein Vadar_015503 [Vaccinium darrowii]
MGDSEAQYSPLARNRTYVRSQPRSGPEVRKPSLPSILHEREKYFKCMVRYLVDYRSISILEMQHAINEYWHIGGRVTVLKKIEKFNILRAETMEDKDDRIHVGPWNINRVVDVATQKICHLKRVATQVQIKGAVLEYFTPDMAVKMGSVIRFVTSVDRGTTT